MTKLAARASSTARICIGPYRTSSSLQSLVAILGSLGFRLAVETKPTAKARHKKAASRRVYASVVSPIRYLSMPRAALRPSAMAQTTSDCPRLMSPAAKTPGTEDI